MSTQWPQPPAPTPMSYPAATGSTTNYGYGYIAPQYDAPLPPMAHTSAYENSTHPSGDMIDATGAYLAGLIGMTPVAHGSAYTASLLESNQDWETWALNNEFDSIVYDMAQGGLLPLDAPAVPSFPGVALHPPVDLAVAAPLESSSTELFSPSSWNGLFTPIASSSTGMWPPIM